MKKLVMGLLGAMMVLSLAACTPTTEKNKTGEVKEPETEAVETTADAGPGVVTGRPVDQDAPDLTMVSVYSVSEDGSKIEGTMDSVETLDAQSLTDLLIQYGVLDDGTKAVSFTTEESVASTEAGPGVSADSTVAEKATLELSQFPSENQEKVLQAVANTFCENMNAETITIKVDGQTLAEGLSFEDAGKQRKKRLYKTETACFQKRRQAVFCFP